MTKTNKKPTKDIFWLAGEGNYRHQEIDQDHVARKISDSEFEVIESKSGNIIEILTVGQKHLSKGRISIDNNGNVWAGTKAIINEEFGYSGMHAKKDYKGLYTVETAEGEKGPYAIGDTVKLKDGSLVDVSLEGNQLSFGDHCLPVFLPLYEFSLNVKDIDTEHGKKVYIKMNLPGEKKKNYTGYIKHCRSGGADKSRMEVSQYGEDGLLYPTITLDVDCSNRKRRQVVSLMSMDAAITIKQMTDVKQGLEKELELQGAAVKTNPAVEMLSKQLDEISRGSSRDVEMFFSRDALTFALKSQKHLAQDSPQPS